MKIEQFIDEFCKQRDISLKTIRGRNRRFDYVNRRAELVNLLRYDWNAPVELIAKLLNRNVTSIRHLLQRGVKPVYSIPKNPLKLIR